MNGLINDMRMNLPREIKQAQGVVAERKKLINDANSEADEIIKRAEMRAKQMVSAQEITRMAQARAQEIMETAQQKSKDMRHTTTDYVDNMLGRAEELFGKNLAEVKKARQALKAGPK
jgi:F0F1-type ATP synthase membrane subunit b/b'